MKIKRGRLHLPIRPIGEFEGDLMFSSAPPEEAEQPAEVADQLLAATWAAAIVALLLAIFAIIYKLSPYYKTGPPS